MDTDTRLALLEQGAEQIEQDHLELRESISELAKAVRELNEWQNRMDLPIRGAGYLFVGLLTAAGYGLWSFITNRL